MINHRVLDRTKDLPKDNECMGYFKFEGFYDEMLTEEEIKEKTDDKVR